MGLISETAEVFDFLRNVFDLLPTAIKLLIYLSFGGLIYLALLRSIGR